ncbi:MAG: XdhC family protein, partial [Chloroflexi bacterium]|nr:XdhC family protein [Chloroflexota bacterium]
MLEIYQQLAELMAKGESAVLATVVASHGSAPRRAGAKMLIKQDGSSVGSIGGGGVEHKVRGKVTEILKSGQPQLVRFDLTGKDDGTLGMICGGQMEVFVEPVIPSPTIYFFGAGHISQCCAEIGRMLGFRIVVIDPRPEYNNPERFPDVDGLIVEEFESAFSRLKIDDNSYIVIYTMGHAVDEQCLQFALGTPARYIGMLGSKRKVIEIKKRLTQKGMPPERLDQV